MTGEERRAAILETIRNSAGPISGTALAKKYQVSRQIIVQDIALLRVANYEIYSTSRGYRLSENQTAEEISGDTDGVTRVFEVSHTDSQIEDELNIIVDNGGKALDVFVNHEVYGSIHGDLNILCRRHVQEFMEGIQSGKSRPLKNLTSGIHFHTVAADSEATLDIIERELQNRGFLIGVEN